jgi:hypothetical protein
MVDAKGKHDTLAANLDSRGGGSQERKILWLSMPELKAAWEKKLQV